MEYNESVLKQEEKIIYELRALYHRYGYSQYKMVKFEEYDLYARNKDYLLSNNIVTFTDVGGKLMALKPDVTLSIIRNGRDVPDTVDKVYYNESVYRVSRNSQAFKEITQVGIECQGDINDYYITETLYLALESLICISEDSRLTLSHLDILTGMIDELNVSGEIREKILRCVEQKNIHEMSRVCAEAGADAAVAERLRRLLNLSGKPACVLPLLKELTGNSAACTQLENIIAMLTASGLEDKILIDFSIVSDTQYYNGIVFKGFIAGIPEYVLSGGQYDKLMARMDRHAGAIGFAVELDLLDRLFDESEPYDADLLLLYDETADMAKLWQTVQALNKDGTRVVAQKIIPGRFRARKIARFDGNEVKTIEVNA